MAYVYPYAVSAISVHSSISPSPVIHMLVLVQCASHWFFWKSMAELLLSTPNWTLRPQHSTLKNQLTICREHSPKAKLTNTTQEKRVREIERLGFLVENVEQKNIHKFSIMAIDWLSNSFFFRSHFCKALKKTCIVCTHLQNQFLDEIGICVRVVLFVCQSIACSDAFHLVLWNLWIFLPWRTIHVYIYIALSTISHSVLLCRFLFHSNFNHTHTHASSFRLLHVIVCCLFCCHFLCLRSFFTLHSDL